MAPCLHEIPHACHARCIAMRAMTEAKRRSRSPSAEERPFTGGRQSEQWPKDLSEAIPAFLPHQRGEGQQFSDPPCIASPSFLASSSSDPNKADNKRVRDGAGSGIPAMPCSHARTWLPLPPPFGFKFRKGSPLNIGAIKMIS